jgi:hypothetical protein
MRLVAAARVTLSRHVGRHTAPLRAAEIRHATGTHPFAPAAYAVFRDLGDPLGAVTGTFGLGPRALATGERA